MFDTTVADAKWDIKRAGILMLDATGEIAGWEWPTGSYNALMAENGLINKAIDEVIEVMVNAVTCENIKILEEACETYVELHRHGLKEFMDGILPITIERRHKR